MNKIPEYEVCKTNLPAILGRTWFILFYVFRVLPEGDVNQVRQHISAYSVVYSMNQVRQNMCRTLTKNGYFIHEQRK